MTFSLKLGQTIFCQSLGNVTVPLSLCPFQPTINSVKDLPVFFTFNATGNYYGVAGSYESIPAFRSDSSGYYFDQCALFSLNGSGIADSDLLLNNPFLYHAKITALTTTFPRLTYPATGSGASSKGNTCVGYDGIKCSNIPTINEISPYDGFGYVNTNISFNPALAESQKLIVNEKRTLIGYDAHTPGRNIMMNTSNLEYLMEDDFFSLIFANNNTQAFGGVSFDPAKTTINNQVQDIQNKGVTKNLNSFRSNSISCRPNEIKIHPVLGTFAGVFLYLQGVFPSTRLWGGNVFGVTDALGDTSFFISKLQLSDPQDDINASSSECIINQAMGGGFLVYNPNKILFYITADLKYYVRINLIFPSSLIPDNIAMDGSGFIYFLRYGAIASQFLGLYWSGGPAISINLPVPTLQNLNVSFDNCNPCSMPWIG